MADYNARFALAPRVAYNAHRPLRPEEDLTQLFTLHESRRISRELTVHYKRDLYVLEDSSTTRRLRGATAVVSEAENGAVTIRVDGRVLPARLYPKVYRARFLGHQSRLTASRPDRAIRDARRAS